MINGKETKYFILTELKQKTEITYYQAQVQQDISISMTLSILIDNQNFKINLYAYLLTYLQICIFHLFVLHVSKYLATNILQRNLKLSCINNNPYIFTIHSFLRIHTDISYSYFYTSFMLTYNLQRVCTLHCIYTHFHTVICKRYIIYIKKEKCFVCLIRHTIFPY